MSLRQRRNVSSWSETRDPFPTDGRQFHEVLLLGEGRHSTNPVQVAQETRQQR